MTEYWYTDGTVNITGNQTWGNAGFWSTDTGNDLKFVRDHPEDTLDRSVDVKALASGTHVVDASEGIVEAFAAAIGNKDSVGDIILPGAFDASLSRRKPRVVWGHNWNEPVGKVLEITEVGSNDHRLPEKMRRAGVGGLYVKVQFNLNTERGREAFETVKFFGEDQEWSIGYKTREANYDPVKGANMLKEVELYEVSPVLHGANQLTGTVSIKSDLVETPETEWIGDEVEEKSPVGSIVGRKLSEALKKPIRIRHTDGSSIVFDTPDGGPFLTSSSVVGNEMRFTKPRSVRMRVVVDPVEDMPKAGGCGGNCGCGKSDIEPEVPEIEVEEKVGRMMSNRTMAKLRQAMELIQSIMADASPPDPEERLERKKKTLKDTFLHATEATDRKAALLGTSDKLSGLVMEVKVVSLDEVVGVLDLVEGRVWAGEVVVKAPTGPNLPSKMSLYLAGDEKSSLDMARNIASELQDGLEVDIKTLDFYGVQTKTLAEIFAEERK